MDNVKPLSPDDLFTFIETVVNDVAHPANEFVDAGYIDRANYSLEDWSILISEPDLLISGIEREPLIEALLHYINSGEVTDDQKAQALSILLQHTTFIDSLHRLETKELPKIAANIWLQAIELLDQDSVKKLRFENRLSLFKTFKLLHLRSWKQKIHFLQLIAVKSPETLGAIIKPYEQSDQKYLPDELEAKIHEIRRKDFTPVGTMSKANMYILLHLLSPDNQKNFNTDLAFNLLNTVYLSALAASIEDHTYDVELLQNSTLSWLSREQQMEILKHAHLAWIKSQYNDLDKITPFGTYGEILYDDQDLDERVEHVMFILENLTFNPAKDDLNKIDQFMLQSIGSAINYQAIKHRYEKFLFDSFPIHSILSASLLDVAEFNQLPINARDEDEMTLKDVLYTYAEQHPEHLSVDDIEVFWDYVEDSVRVRSLLRYQFQYLPARNPQPDYIANGQHPNSSLQIVCAATGLNLCDLEASPFWTKASSDSLSKLYSLLLNIQAPLNQPAFTDVGFQASAYRDKKKFLELLGLIRDTFFVMGERNIESWQKTVDLLKLRKKITDKNIDQLIQDTRKRLITYIKDLLSDEDRHDVSITYDDFSELMNLWGDIEPIMTLYARFYGEKKEKFKQQIPNLLKVFEASLQGNFREFKFGKLKEKDPQIEHLTDKEFRAWIKPRYIITPSGGTQGTSMDQLRAEALKQINDIYNRNLSEHMNDLSLKGLSEFVAQTTSHKSYKSLNKDLFVTNDFKSILSSAPQEALSVILKANSRGSKSPTEEEQLSIFYYAYEQISKLVKDTKSPSTEEKLELIDIWARYALASLVNSKTFDETVRKQILNDLKALSKSARVNTDSSDKKDSGIIFTVLSSDPKLMLTIGDLVDTTSCQSYSAGGMIYSLLGYVMDANTRAVASFYLQPNDFTSSDDYSKLADLLRTRKRYKVHWNGNRKELTIHYKDEDGKEISIATQALKHAYLRQLVKLGKAVNEETYPLGSFKYHDVLDFSNGIRLESEYAQTHSSLELMRENHHLIKEQLQKDLHAENEDLPVLFAPSKNKSGGTYTDLGDNHESSQSKLKTYWIR